MVSKLFDRHGGDVFRLGYSVLRNKEEAEDLVQSLFLEVHTTMLRYDGQKGSFRTLLLRYAYTRAIDHRRHLECRRYYSSVQLEEVLAVCARTRSLSEAGRLLFAASRALKQKANDSDLAMQLLREQHELDRRLEKAV